MLWVVVRLCPGLILMLLLGCGKQGTSKSEARVEKPIPLATPQVQKAPEPPLRLPPPAPAEVESALHRVFGDDLVREHGTRPAFIVGDFNGDNSQDLAVIVRPAPGKLNDINGELANWTIQDADNFFVPPSGKRVFKAPNIATAKVMAGEEILAIIHGYGPKGWRNPDARQGYLVKHAAATFLGTAPSISQKAIRTMHLPVQTDIIQELRGSKKGFLFWTGAAYAWHPGEGSRT
jgi:hypothetical protein